MSDCKFQDAVEQHPSASGVPTVEAEHELVEVAWQVGGIHGALVGAKYPALGQGGDPVHSREEFTGVFSASPGGPLASTVPGLPFVFNPDVAIPAVCNDG